MPNEPRIIEFSPKGKSPRHYQIFRMNNNSFGEWLSVKHGWLLALRKNVRLYSKFSSYQSAQAAISKAEGR